MKLEQLPHGGHSVPKDVHTEVFQALRRVLGLWAEDSERLATAAYAYCWTGFWWGNLGYEVHSALAELHHVEGKKYVTVFTEDQCWDLVRRSLRGRQERLLKHRAYGLLIGLEATAAAYEFERLHRSRIASAMIDERLKRLREMDQPKQPEGATP